MKTDIKTLIEYKENLAKQIDILVGKIQAVDDIIAYENSLLEKEKSEDNNTKQKTQTKSNK